MTKDKILRRILDFKPTHSLDSCLKRQVIEFKNSKMIINHVSECHKYPEAFYIKIKSNIGKKPQFFSYFPAIDKAYVGLGYFPHELREIK